MNEQQTPAAMSQQLDPEEKVLWLGRPSPKAYLLGGALVTYPLGVIAVASAWTWTSGVSWPLIPLWAKTVLALVALFALHMLVSRPLLSLFLARHTYYAITNRRALVVCDVFGGRIQQLAHDEGELHTIKNAKGSGKIQFSRSASSSFDVLLLGRAAIPGFYGLPHVDHVLAELERHRKQDPS
jgi:hypothetical protein